MPPEAAGNTTFSENDYPSPVEPSWSWFYPFIICLCSFGLLGHCIVMRLVFWSAELRKRLSILLVAWLLVSDVIWCSWLIFRYSLVVALNHNLWTSDDAECKIESIILASCVCQSLLSSLLIAFERYRCICTPMHTLSHAAALKMYGAGWGFTAVLVLGSIPSYTQTDGHFYCHLNFYDTATVLVWSCVLLFPCLGGMAYCYFRVFQSLRLQMLQHNCPTDVELSSKSSIEKAAEAVMKEKADIAVKLLSLAGFLIVCWTPAILYMCGAAFKLIQRDQGPAWVAAVGTGCMLNSAFNPWCVLLILKVLRRAVVKDLKACFRVGPATD